MSLDPRDGDFRERDRNIAPAPIRCRMSVRFCVAQPPGATRQNGLLDASGAITSRRRNQTTKTTPMSGAPQVTRPSRERPNGIKPVPMLRCRDRVRVFRAELEPRQDEPPNRTRRNLPLIDTRPSQGYV
jgi:hypothetical protein